MFGDDYEEDEIVEDEFEEGFQIISYDDLMEIEFKQMTAEEFNDF